MWQRIVNWFKHLFSHEAPVHREDNGLWWQQDDNLVKVGLDSKVISELGDITFLETPQVDESIQKADQLIDIEGGKAVETFKSPVSGKISKVYDGYQNDPTTLTAAENPLLVEITTA
jgi:glycine cleavage system H protein